MVGNLIDQIWRIAVEVFNRSSAESGAAALHVAQFAGVVG